MNAHEDAEVSAADAAPQRPSRAAAIWRRTRTGAALVGALVASFWLTHLVGSSWPVFVIGTGLAAATVVELGRMGRLRGRGFTAVAGTALGAVVLVWVLMGGEVREGAFLATGFAVYSAAGATALLVALALRATRPHEPALVALWLVPPLPLLAEVHAYFGLGGLVALVALSKVGDIAGYYGGSAFGRHHPFKRLSPGKTTEGCAASFVVATLCGPLCAWLGLFGEGVSVGPALVAAASVNLAAQGGDLLESWVKRRAQVKDSSTWLGASGGFLDVCDSLLVTVPVALATWPHLFP